jgi:phosphatidylglycerol:prolipoprotein diacylglycerol transferase
VLFRLPIPNPWGADLPIYGFGTMLVIALFLCTWLAGRRAKKEGIAKEIIQDLAFWIVIGGIVGARVVFMIQYFEQSRPQYVDAHNVVQWNRVILHFFYFWEGGLVWYGGLLGGVAGYALGYRFVLRKHNISTWKIADIIAPSLALGLALGRVGCLLNGCCYGNIAPADAPAIHFPIHSFAGRIGDKGGPVSEGIQAVAGFTVTRQSADDPTRSPATVGAVDASSDAARAGLQPGDVIIQADDQKISDYAELSTYLLIPDHWQNGKTDLKLTVLREGKEIELPAFAPRTIGLHPTQVYETISMLLLFLVLLAYTPFRRHDGEVFLLFLLCYPIHRFLNEMLRNDTDPVAFGMTLSQNGSILLVLVAVALWVWMLRKPVEYHPLKQAAVLQPTG